MCSHQTVREPKPSPDRSSPKGIRPEVSVFTATFNRAHTLHRVWESLRNQTFKNFEWVIIDDGSTDNTEEVVRKFCTQSIFPIRYFYQKNRGKHTAYNLFARHANATLFCSIDSDDEVLPIFLERMLFHFNSIPNGEKNNYAGVMCLAQDQRGDLIGDKFSQEDFEDGIVGALLRHKKLGDKGGITKVDVLLEFPFPEDVERVYVPESYHIHGYTTRYKTKFVNEVLIQPWIDKSEEHLSDALSRRENDPGSIYGLLAWPKYSMVYFWRNPRLFIAITSKYIAVGLDIGKTLPQQFLEIENAAGRALWLALIPLGFVRLIARRIGRE